VDAIKDKKNGIKLNSTEMDSKDRKRWAKFRKNESNTITGAEVTLISELHAKYFNHKYWRLCTCNPKKAQLWISQLNDLYDETTPKRGRPKKKEK
jgi:hypothetical protein